MIHLREQYWAMEVPADAWVWDKDNFRTDFIINMGYLIYPKVGKKKWVDGMKLPGLDYNERVKGYVQLPAGKWELFGTTKVCDENEAKKIVKQYGSEYLDYTTTEEDWNNKSVNLFKSAIDSLKSLLSSKGCDPDINYLILKKVA